MIGTIKVKGFDQISKIIENKEKIRAKLKISVDTLQNKLNFLNSHQKKFGFQNSKIQSETFMYKQINEVSELLLISFLEN